MPFPLTNETGANQVAAGGPGWEFGASTPPASGDITVDGVALNNGATLATGTVPAGANNRTTGSVSIAGSSSTNVSVSKSVYCVFTVDHVATSVYVSAITTSTVTLLQTSAVGSTVNYSFL